MRAEGRGEAYCIALRCCEQCVERALTPIEDAVAVVALDMPHAGVQRITAARAVEARFLWKRFCRSRNDARP
jgi:hypothetical protein